MAEGHLPMADGERMHRGGERPPAQGREATRGRVGHVRVDARPRAALTGRRPPADVGPGGPGFSMSLKALQKLRAVFLPRECLTTLPTFLTIGNSFTA